MLPPVLIPLSSDDAAASFTLGDFRMALGRFATGVAIAATIGKRGEPVGITINSFASVSLDPPLVLFALERSAHSFPAFTGAGHFAVNILAR